MSDCNHLGRSINPSVKLGDCHTYLVLEVGVWISSIARMMCTQNRTNAPRKDEPRRSFHANADIFFLVVYFQDPD